MSTVASKPWWLYTPNREPVIHPLSHRAVGNRGGGGGGGGSPPNISISNVEDSKHISDVVKWIVQSIFQCMVSASN